jgi:uncharacterized protein (TIGR03084 family)
MTVFDDLQAEQDRLQLILGGLQEAQWAAPSAAAGWSIADVVIHLAQSEESVLASVMGESIGDRSASDRPLDEIMDILVRSEQAPPDQVFLRWREARQAALAALRAADPQRPVQWVEGMVKPATLATTRLAENWAHGLDITAPSGIDFPDTDRLKHIAWLAHRTLPYAFAVAGEEPREVRCELTAPDGSVTWQYGPPDADSVISGAAGAFCRVAVQRLAPEQSGLRTEGPHSAAALRAVRTYAV